ncbi:MAG TPA: toxin-antitoxin system HicB family antitoxin [Roseiflexaceae bacterium]|nr:toxin-antitoxin system HicB family antitoxin [Roseiflexaceae bacterium]
MLWIYFCPADGKLLVRMPRSLHQALAQHAEVEGVSLNLLVVTLLGRGLGQRTSVIGQDSTLAP